jgi:hypothetical protein
LRGRKGGEEGVWESGCIEGRRKEGFDEEE